MRNVRLKYLLPILFLINYNIYAHVLYATNGASVQVLVDKNYGATIELPGEVRVVTPPKYVRVEPLGEPALNTTQNSESNSINDVRVFQVYPSIQKKYTDKMTFLLWNGKSVSVNFVGVENTSDNFYQIKFNGNSEEKKSFASNSKYFLSDEKSLMVKMLKDDGGTDRKILDAKVIIDKYPDLLVKLVRIFKQESLTGYVLTVTNTSENTVTLNPTVLTIGSPNKIIMIQSDHEKLESCKTNSDPNPRGSGCMTAMRIVLKDANEIDIPSLGSQKHVFTLVQGGLK